MDEQEDLAKDMLEQVRKIKVRYNLFLGPSLPFLKWMYLLAGLSGDQNLALPCQWNCTREDEKSIIPNIVGYTSVM